MAKLSLTGRRRRRKRLTIQSGFQRGRAGKLPAIPGGDATAMAAIQLTREPFSALLTPTKKKKKKKEELGQFTLVKPSLCLSMLRKR